MIFLVSMNYINSPSVGKVSLLAHSSVLASPQSFDKVSGQLDNEYSQKSELSLNYLVHKANMVVTL